VGGPSLVAADGVLREPCEEEEACDFNQQAFKGVFVRYLRQLDDALCAHPYRDFIASNARAAWGADRNGSDYFGTRWSGPFDNATIATQASAASLMVAAMDLV